MGNNCSSGFLSKVTPIQKVHRHARSVTSGTLAWWTEGGGVIELYVDMKKCRMVF